MAGLNGPVAFRTKGSVVSNAAVAISAAGFAWTAGDVEAADQAVISAHTNGLVMTWDGTTPTATLGMAVAAGSTVTVQGNRNVRNLQFIRSGAADCNLSVTLEKF